MKMQVAVGARFVGVPGTVSENNPRGVMIEVHWEQDDTGSLCISRHSPETQIPTGIQQMPPLRRRSKKVQGIVIDPDQIHPNNDQQ